MSVISKPHNHPYRSTYCVPLSLAIFVAAWCLFENLFSPHKLPDFQTEDRQRLTHYSQAKLSKCFVKTKNQTKIVARLNPSMCLKQHWASKQYSKFHHKYNFSYGSYTKTHTKLAWQDYPPEKSCGFCRLLKITFPMCFLLESWGMDNFFVSSLCGASDTGFKNDKTVSKELTSLSLCISKWFIYRQINGLQMYLDF